MKNISSNEIISTTTRKIRIADGEVDGINYNFVDINFFKKLIEKNLLIEYSLYDNNYYGITKNEVLKKIDLDSPCFAIVDYNGMKKLKEIFPDSISIFIDCTLEDCQVNLAKREKENEKFINKRLEKYKEDTEHKNEYDFIVLNKNNHLNKAIEEIKNIIKIKKEL